MKRIDKILHGGDYNPNQWPEEEWPKDLALFREAHINAVTLNVFSWAKLQPSEDVYDFGQLDRMIKFYADAGFDIVLATSTAATPAWMYKKYPEVARTDFEGRRHKFGMRHNACPNSVVYQTFARKLAGKLAERYGGVPAVKLWHINNEYGGACFCENCEKVFRQWLRKRYNTLDKLNAAWNTEFWGHTIYDWDEVVAPNRISEAASKSESAFEGISVDYRRFNSESMLANFKSERDEIRKYDTETLITSNLMGTYKTINYHQWGSEMDVVSWDSYPTDNDPPSLVAMRHGIMRGLKNGKPFLLMEQNPTQQTFDGFLRKEPGKMRAWSYQALAHGANSLLYFQLKNSVGASEKYCGSVIGHANHGDTRVFREVSILGKELEKLGGGLTEYGRIESKVAFLYDWESYWALDYDRNRGTNKDLNYIETVHHFYRYFHERNIPVDFISPKSDLSGYKLVVLPVLYMIGNETRTALEKYVGDGGNIVVTYMSGMVDETTNVIRGGYPGAVKEIAGIWVEETDYLNKDMLNHVAFKDGKIFPCEQTCDIIHPQGAKPVAVYKNSEFYYDGMPAVTVNEYGYGKSFYVGVRLRQDGLAAFYDDVCEQLELAPVVESEQGLEITRRTGKSSDYYFIINHDKAPKNVPSSLAGYTDMLSGEQIKSDMMLARFDVLVVEVEKKK